MGFTGDMVSVFPEKDVLPPGASPFVWWSCQQPEKCTDMDTLWKKKLNERVHFFYDCFQVISFIILICYAASLYTGYSTVAICEMIFAIIFMVIFMMELDKQFLMISWLWSVSICYTAGLLSIALASAWDTDSAISYS